MALHKNIKLLSFHNFLTDFVLFAPVAILYFQQVTGSYALGMSIFSIAYASSAILEIPTGILSDFVGRRKTLILGSLSSVLCIVFYAMGTSYWILFIGAIFQGLSRSFYSGNNDALLHDTLSETHQQHVYDEFLGKTASLFQVGLAISSIIGGFIASWSFQWVMWISVIPQLAAFIVSLGISEPNIHKKISSNMYEHVQSALQSFLNQKKLQYLSIASVIRFALGESAYFFRSAFVATLWPVWAIGFSSMLSNIGAAISFYFSGKILKKYGYKKVLQFEIIFNRAINLIALLFPTVFSPALVSLSSITFGVGTVATNTLLQKEFSDTQRATMGSINSFFGSMAFAVCSIVLGSFADRFGVIPALITIHILLISPLFFYKKVFSQSN